MVNKALILIALICSGCGLGYQAVYIDRDIEVLTGLGRIKCERAYSTWDGVDWVDWYGPPCNIFIIKPGLKIK